MEIIAEIGQNHNGDISKAKELIYAVKDSGAEVAKFQRFDMSFWESIYKKNKNMEKEWKEYHSKTCLGIEDTNELIELCKKLNVEFLCSVFNEKFIDFLEQKNVKRYKLASNCINNLSIIKRLEETNKDLIISLGMWNKEEFPEINSNGEISFLYCVSKYPTELNDLNFSNIDFTKYDGFSDHTIGLNASMIAFARGAKIIEKHLTLDKKMFGPDHEGSITPDELKTLVDFKNDLKLSL